MRVGRVSAIPDAVSAALERLLGERIGHVKVIEHSWFARLHGACATTRLQRIYLRDSAEDFFGNPWLMLHEYCHVLRQWQTGALTVPRYLLECLRHGYWNNRFEVEARRFADQNAAQLHSLLAASGHWPPGGAAAERSAEQRLAAVESPGHRHEQRGDGERRSHR
jgi:hypothetical protein